MLQVLNELNDQVYAFGILADQLGYIDMNRVGIHGWFYGKFYYYCYIQRLPSCKVIRVVQTS